MFKSLDSIASVVGIFMYLTISKFKQVLRSRKGLDYNTALNIHCINHNSPRQQRQLLDFEGFLLFSNNA